jgi:hypothetical protein
MQPVETGTAPVTVHLSPRAPCPGSPLPDPAGTPNPYRSEPGRAGSGRGGDEPCQRHPPAVRTTSRPAHRTPTFDEKRASLERGPGVGPDSPHGGAPSRAGG